MDPKTNKPICMCLTGFTGEKCEHALTCSDKPCGERFICEDKQDDLLKYTCKCADGYFGKDCLNQITDKICTTPEPEDCKEESINNKCINNDELTLIRCPKTCGLCKETISENECIDSIDGCSYISEYGLCRVLSTVCSKSCNIC